MGIQIIMSDDLKRRWTFIMLVEEDNFNKECKVGLNIVQAFIILVLSKPFSHLFLGQ